MLFQNIMCNSFDYNRNCNRKKTELILIWDTKLTTINFIFITLFILVQFILFSRALNKNMPSKDNLN